VVVLPVVTALGAPRITASAAGEGPVCTTQASLLCIVAGSLGQSGTPTPGPATNSDLHGPSGVAVDAGGNLYIADSGNNVVEEVTPSGALSVVAGTGSNAAPPTPGPATSSDLGGPSGVAVDAGGDLYIADYDYHVVVEVTPTGTLSVVAGTGNWGAPTPGPATSCDIESPTGLALDGSGNLYITDLGNDVVEKVTPSGTLSVVAGTGTGGSPTPGPATSSDLQAPVGVAVDSAGNLYIADADNYGVERVTPTGTLSVVAAGGGLPIGVAVDSAGNLYISDWSTDVVEELTPAGTVSLVAGTSGGETYPGSQIDLHGVAVDSAGNLYIPYSTDEVVRMVAVAASTSVTPAPSASTPVTLAPSASTPAAVAPSTNASVTSAPSASTSVSPAPSTAVSPAHTSPGEPPSAVPLLVAVGSAILLLAGILVFLVSRRRRRSADRTIQPPAAGGPPGFTAPLPPPPPPFP
jgi:sugar lactone lactonase YvrE